MAPRLPAPFPTKEAVLAFIRNSPVPVGKREVARAFKLSGSADRERLKLLMKALEADGAVERGHGRRVAPPHTRPSDTGLAWEDLDTRWAQSRAGLERAAAELRHTPGRTLWHPFFGELDAMDWMRMVAIHLNNHRKQLEASAAA